MLCDEQSRSHSAASSRRTEAHPHIGKPSSLCASTENWRKSHRASSEKRYSDWHPPEYYASGRLGAFMNFLVAIHKDPDSDYGVSVPDLPGCISAGSTFAEALTMVKEAIELHLESMLEDGQDIPDPTTDIEKLRSEPDYRDAIWAV